MHKKYENKKFGCVMIEAHTVTVEGDVKDCSPSGNFSKFPLATRSILLTPTLEQKFHLLQYR